MQFEVIIFLIVYLVVVFGLFFYVMRKCVLGSFFNEYFFGSCLMGGFVLVMMLIVIYISVSLFIGGFGVVYKYGLGWVLLVMIQFFVIWLLLGVLGKKFVIFVCCYNVVIFNDMLFVCYQSCLLVWLVSLSLLVVFVGVMIVQFIGGVCLLEMVVGIFYDIGLLIFGVSIVLYIVYGGFCVSVFNDMMQGMVMLIGMIVLLVGVIYVVGGVGYVVEMLQLIDVKLVFLQGVEDIFLLIFMVLFWVLVCFGVIGLLYIVVCCIFYKDSKVVYCGIIIGIIVVVILMFGMYLVGVLGWVVIFDLIVLDLVILMLMVKVFLFFVVGIFFVVLMVVIMLMINV